MLAKINAMRNGEIRLYGKKNVLGIGRKKFNVHVDPRNTVALSGLALWAVALEVELGPWPDQSGAPVCKWTVLVRTVMVPFTSSAHHQNEEHSINIFAWGRRCWFCYKIRGHFQLFVAK